MGWTARRCAPWKVPRVEGRIRDALLDAGLATATAVVCLLGDDLRAMETALLVRRLRPDVRLVVRMGNAGVGRALVEVTGEGSVLDVAALAAPSMGEACLGTRTHAIELAGRQFLVAELPAGSNATLRELYGELAPLAVADDAGPVVVCPGRDHRVRVGDRVTVAGTPGQFGTLGMVDVLRPQSPVRPGAGARSAGAQRAVDRAKQGGRAGLRSLLRSLVTEADRPLRVTLAVLAVAVVISIVVLRIGYVKDDGSHMGVVDAVYFTVETIATVGYGDWARTRS